METNELRCFLLVAEELHISRAARRAHLSQPAMSRLVRRIEHDVGAVLIDRSGTGLSLTPAGIEFAAGAKDIVATVDRAIRQARVAATGQRTRRDRPRVLRIGMFFPAAAELTAPILTAYMARRPEVAIETVDITGLAGEVALTTGRVDVAFLWSPVSSREIECVTLFEDRFALLVSDDHALTRRSRLLIEDVSGLRYTVTISMSKAWQRASMLGPWRDRPDQAVRVGTVTDAMQAVQSGRAVSIGPTCLARYAPVSGVKYLPLKVTTHPRSLLCRRRPGHHAEPDVDEFVASATRTAGRLASLVPVPRPSHPTTDRPLTSGQPVRSSTPLTAGRVT